MQRVSFAEAIIMAEVGFFWGGLALSIISNA